MASNANATSGSASQQTRCAPVDREAAMEEAFTCCRVLYLCGEDEKLPWDHFLDVMERLSLISRELLKECDLETSTTVLKDIGTVKEWDLKSAVDTVNIPLSRLGNLPSADQFCLYACISVLKVIGAAFTGKDMKDKRVTLPCFIPVMNTVLKKLWENEDLARIAYERVKQYNSPVVSLLALGLLNTYSTGSNKFATRRVFVSSVQGGPSLRKNYPVHWAKMELRSARHFTERVVGAERRITQCPGCIRIPSNEAFQGRVHFIVCPQGHKNVQPPHAVYIPKL